MNAIRNIFNAFSNLAASINALAGVIDVATGRLRQSLAIDTEPPARDHSEGIDADSTNGTARRGKRQPA